jgi:hypothetical protein
MFQPKTAEVILLVDEAILPVLQLERKRKDSKAIMNRAFQKVGF